MKNPLFPGYYADPESRFFEGRVWIYPTRSLPFDEQTNLDAFSSNNMTEWTRHSDILDRDSCPWLRRALWAPVVFSAHGRYYMIFSANDPKVLGAPFWKPEDALRDQTGGLGLAVSDQPEGPFRDILGRPLIGAVHNGTQPIDACVVSPQANEFWIAYGGWGHCNRVRLNDDLTDVQLDTLEEITPSPDYVEGPFFFQRADWWYFLWSEGNWSNHSYRMCYARSQSFNGPWTTPELLMEPESPLASGAGHCSVLEHPDGNYFLLYHRRPQDACDHNARVVCAEPMHFAPDGRISRVTMS